MAIDHISNSSLMTQLELMNKQMSSLSQGASRGVPQGTPEFGYIGGQSPFFNGDSAARALRDQAAATVNSAMNSGVINNTYNGDKVYQPAPSAGQTVGEFKQLLKDAFENVNIIQNESASMASRFDVGDRSVTLADVMIASNKSSLSFEATLQVRNKLVDAYQTIMQMQI